LPRYLSIFLPVCLSLSLLPVAVCLQCWSIFKHFCLSVNSATCPTSILVCLSTSLPVCFPTTWLPRCLSIFFPVCLSLSLLPVAVCLDAGLFKIHFCLSVYFATCQTFMLGCLSTCLPVCIPPTCLPPCSSVCLYVCLSLFT
jgi:hypothetical protein